MTTVVLKYTQKFFDIPAVKPWSLIPFPRKNGRFYQFTSNEGTSAEAAWYDLQDEVMAGFITKTGILARCPGLFASLFLSIRKIIVSIS